MTKESDKPKQKRGFALLSPERHRMLASMGGKAVPKDTRTFSKDRNLAAAAGKKGGSAVPKEKRSFVRDPAVARKAGRKGGLALGRRSRAEDEAPPN